MRQKVGIIIAASALLLGAAIVGWQYFKSPSRVVERAINELAASDSKLFEANVRLENTQATQAVLGERGQLELTTQGSFKRTAEAAPSVESQFTLTARSESVSVQLAGQVRLIEDQVFLMLEKVPAAFPLLNTLKGRWLELPRGAHSTEPTLEPPKPLLHQVTYQGSETINDKKTYQYTAQAPQDTAVYFVNGLVRMLGSRLTEEHINQLKAGAAQQGAVPIEIWVAPLSHKLRQLHLQLGGASQNNIDITIRFNEVTKEPQIEKPGGSRTFEEILAAPNAE